MEIVKGNILVVEDNIMLQESMATLFIENGYKVKAVKNGYQALDNVRKEAFDLAVVNMQLSEMSGLTTMQAMKIIDPAIAVVITSTPYDEDPEILISKGADACTSILFSGAQILDTIKQVLMRKGLRSPERNRQRRIFKRRDIRIPIRYSQRYSSGLPTKIKESTTKNISAGGLFFESDELISPFASLDMTIELPPSQESESASIINSLTDVMWVEKIKETGRYGIGTKLIENKGTAEKQLLDKLVDI